MERARGITIQSAAISFNWPPQGATPKGAGKTAQDAPPPKTINLIDTPGHQDFRFEVDRCLPVLDGAVCIIDSVKGVEAHTERVWASAQQHNIPRIAYVNKLDRDGASFNRSVTDIASRLNAWPLVCQIPLWDKDKGGEVFLGIADVIARRGIKWPASGSGGGSLVTAETLQSIYPTLWAEMETARTKLVEKLCEYDDALVEAFCEQGTTDLPAAQIKAAIRRVVLDPEVGRKGRVVPVFAGSSLRNIGVEPLLDAVVDYLPSPHESPDVEVRIGKDTRMLRDVYGAGQGKKGAKAVSARSTAGALASVFKVVNDPNLFPGTQGMLTFVRVYQGALHKNAQVWNANLARFEKPFQIAQVSAAKIGEIPYLAPGQIGAITGLKAARTGDTLHILPTHAPPGTPLAALKTMTIRPPEVGPAVAFVNVEAYGGPTETKRLADALDKLTREDPSLRVSRGDEPGIEDTFVLSGLGQLHLDVAMDRLRTTYQLAGATFSSVQVDYKECLTVASAGTPQRYVYDRVVANKAGMAACTVGLEKMEEAEALQERSAAAGTQHDADKQHHVYTFERDGNVVCIKFTGGTTGGESADGGEATGPGELPFDADMVSRQLFNGAIGALARGPRRGSPLQGLRINITFDAATDYAGAGSTTDGHIVHAALQGVRSALREAHARHQVAVLEPVMMVHIACPDDSAGAIQRDITGARGGFVLEIRDSSGSASMASETSGAADAGSASASSGLSGTGIDLGQVYVPPDPYMSIQSLRETKRGMTRLLEIVAKVPLKEMLSYDMRLRSMTGGRHSFTMELASFDRVVGAREREL